jgi:hypothetical protein
MTEALGSVAGAAMQQAKDAQQVKTQDGAGKRSFEQVMQQQQQTETQTTSNQPMTTGVSGAGMDAKLQQLQTELTQKISNINPTDKVPSGKGDILPDLFYNKTRMGLLKEAYNGMPKNQTAVDFGNRFSQVENEYKQIEGIMKSNKDLSPGELLGLQARLYQVSQHIEVMSKVVDQVTGGIKTILNTNV